MTALLYVQADGTLFVQSDHEAYDVARTQLLTFAELSHRLDPIHVYVIQPITLWQAASLGRTARDILSFLRAHAAHPMPFELQSMIVSEMGKWGKLFLHPGGRSRIVLRGSGETWDSVRVLEDISSLALEVRSDELVFRLADRATVKRALTHAGYPVLDRIGYQASPRLPFTIRDGSHFRDYQAEAIAHFLQEVYHQSGVIVLPCGAGKTFVGIGVVAQLQTHALILTPSESSARQWLREFMERTSLTENEVSLYQTDKDVTPITITTYQRVSTRDKVGNRRHLAKLTRHPWGIVVYDEVHMLPAPLFRLAADLQGARRLGLTATLIREDGAERDVFSLIGPKCYEVPWKQLERQGYLSAVRCVEVRVELTPEDREQYMQASPREKQRIAALNSNKLSVMQDLHRLHHGESTLVMGHYLANLKEASERLKCPLITGQTPQTERDLWFDQFRKGIHRTVVLSRVANMAVDLPCASVAIQLSGLFGSRQEEAQRLGRLLRPQTSEGVFYTLVSQDTVEERHARHRQMYLIEQGYHYEICHSEELKTEGMEQDESFGMS